MPPVFNVVAFVCAWARGERNFLGVNERWRLRRGGSVAVLFLPAAMFGAEPVTLQTIEKSAREWVKTRTETVRLETEWASERGLLASTVEGMKERAQLLEEKHAEWKAKTAEERTELDGLEAKRAAAASEVAAVEARLSALTAELMRLRPGLPPRLSDALEMSFRSLAGTELSVGERMQLAMTVLNRCAQFNRGITQGEEVLTLEGEAGAKSLEAIYWGLSHGYALDRASGRAWFGSPKGERWQWEPRPEATAQVEQLIAIHTDRADPAFVSVPAHVKKTFTAGSVQ